MKLDGLIQRYCPNEVVYKPLHEVTKLGAGDRVTKAMMCENQLYPVYGGGVEPTGMYSNSNREKAVTIARAGSAGFVNWVEGKFWATDVCFVAEQLEGKESPNIKYVYYYLKHKQPVLQKQLYGGTLPKLNKEFLWSFPIPLPPLPVQEEIVRILDSFTQLTAELTAELEARTKQYEFYREKLLSFDGLQGGGV